MLEDTLELKIVGKFFRKEFYPIVIAGVSGWPGWP
jgi:hypothetical protein